MASQIQLEEGWLKVLEMEFTKPYFIELKSKLIEMQYEPVKQSMEAGMFDVRGDMRDIYPSTEKVIYRLHFSDDHLDYIEKKDSLTFEDL